MQPAATRHAGKPSIASVANSGSRLGARGSHQGSHRRRHGILRDSSLSSKLDADVIECPVCGYAGLKSKPYEQWPPSPDIELVPPYEEVLGRPSYEICPRCGFEFGNDDNPGTAPPVSFEEYRREWEARGSPWFSEPPGGDAT